MLALDNNANIQPLPRANYVDICSVEENPWRKLFHSGTAGATTELFCAERLNKGATYQFLRLEKKSAPNAIAATQNDIETLISSLKPSMSQLAAAFGVSRQRIYDWRNGEGMSASNMEQMSALLTAARMLSEKSSVPSQVANRKLSGGKTFWDAISSGVSPSDAAMAVLAIIERDESERNALKRSLASRKVAGVKEPPMFSAHLSE